MRTPATALSLLLFLVLLACDPAPRGLLDPGGQEEEQEVKRMGEGAGAVLVQDTPESIIRSVAIGMVVKDLAAAEVFYGELLGLEPAGGFTVDEDFARRSGLTDGATLEVKQYKFGNGPGATTLKLVKIEGTPAHERNLYISNDTGVQYLTIYVDDVAEIKQRLEAAGIGYKGEGPMNLGSEEEPRAFILVQDPSGTFVELIEE